MEDCLYPRSCYSLLTISPRFVNRLNYVKKLNFLPSKPHVMKYVNRWTANWKTISLREGGLPILQKNYGWFVPSFIGKLDAYVAN